MGVYTEYLDKNWGFAELTLERKKQLKRIATLRKRDVLVFAADLNKGTAPISINYTDLLPIQDQISNLTGDAVDLVLETPGGSGEVAEDIVELLRDRFKEVAVIVPGWAKSAGTIIAMAADEILMGPISALGPIDAQLAWQGKVFSADALLVGFEKIKDEVLKTGNLNRAYIPILQGISPGELQSAQNTLDFAKDLVTNWLAIHKFKNWKTRASTKVPVTDQDRRDRAEEIAKELCEHGKWFTHGRSIKIGDLRKMRLLITDFSEDADLHDAIQRYYALLQMTFSTTIYKIFETPQSQILRFAAQAVPTQRPGESATVAMLDVNCPKCANAMRVQANLKKGQPLKEGCVPFPDDSRLRCTSCGTEINLTDARRQIEAQAKQAIVTEAP